MAIQLVPYRAIERNDSILYVKMDAVYLRELQISLEQAKESARQIIVARRLPVFATSSEAQSAAQALEVFCNHMPTAGTNWRVEVISV